jgi:hypothetical protein
MADDNDGLAGRLPEGLFPALLRPFLDDAWSVAVAVYVLAMVVYLLGYWVSVLAENHAHQSFRDFLGGLVYHHFEVLAPAVLLAVALVALAPKARRGNALFVDASLLGMVVVAVIVILGDLLGMVIDLSYAGRGLATLSAEFSIHLGALLVGAAAGLWALSELESRRRPGTPPPGA